MTFRAYIGKEHPTEKPVSLMTWCLKAFPITPTVICDPYLGGGSTLIAAKKIGIKAIGIEREESYLEIAARRLSQGVLELTAV